VLDYKKFTDPVKIEFKKIIMEPVKKPLQEMDPNHPMIAQRNRIIREQEAYIQDLAKGLLTKNLELKNFALKTQQAQQDIIEQEDVLNFRNRIERQLE
jgi:small-conductance mechanosensitive channel